MLTILIFSAEWKPGSDLPVPLNFSTAPPPNYTYLTQVSRATARKHSGNNSFSGGGTGFHIRETANPSWPALCNALLNDD